MKLGISTASFYPLETELAFEEIAKQGVKNTEIFFNCESELKDSFIDILLEIKEKYGINIDSLHPTMSLAESFMIFSAYERRFSESVRQYDRYAKIAKRLGAKYIIMHGGKPNGILSDEEYCQRYMTLKSTALQNGVTVLQENVRGFRSGDIEFMRSMIEILGKDAEFCIDIKQAVRTDNEPIAFAKEFLPYTRHFHISDHSIASDCQLPLDGSFDFPTFFELLKNYGYDGSMMIEVYNNSYKSYKEIFNSFDNLKKLLK